MLNLKKLLSRLVGGMSVVPAINNMEAVTITNDNKITPTKNGWLRLVATTDSTAPTISPVLRVLIGNEVIDERIGIIAGSSNIYLGLPVRAECTYTLGAYRCTINKGATKLFPDAKVGGVISYLIHLTESLKFFYGRRWACAEPQEAVNKDTDCADRTASSYTCERCDRMGELRTSRAHGNDTGCNKRDYGKRSKRSFSHRLAGSAERMDFGDYFAVFSLSRLSAHIKQWSTCSRFNNSGRNKRYPLCLLLPEQLTIIPRKGVIAC